MAWSVYDLEQQPLHERERDQQYYNFHYIEKHYLRLQTIVKPVSRSPIDLPTISGVEGCLPLIPLSHPYQMVGFVEVELSEDGGPLVRSGVKLGVRAQ